MKPATRSEAVHVTIGGMIAMAVAIGVGRFVYTPILPAMAKALSLSEAQAGLIASANFVGYLAGALLASSCLPGSRRVWLLGALALCAVTTGAMGLVSSMPAFLALRGVGGAASAFVLVFASALILDRLAFAGRPGLSALHFAGVGIGIALSAVLVSALMSVGAGWRTLWLASGGASLLAMMIVVPLVPSSESNAASPRQVRLDRPDRGLRILFFAYGLFGFGYVITATFLVVIVREKTDLRSIEPLVWVVVGVAAAPSVALWTRVANRLGVMGAFAAACVVEAIGVSASVLWLSAAGLLLAAVLLGGTMMGVTALILSGARQLTEGKDPRRAFGLMTAAFGVGQIVGPVTAGYLRDATGGFTLPSLLAAGALIAAAALVIGGRIA